MGLFMPENNAFNGQKGTWEVRHNAIAVDCSATPQGQ